MDPAEHLRARLADRKRRARRFDWSSRTGRAAALAAAPEGRERDEWSAAFGGTRAAWRRAYTDADPAPAERAPGRCSHRPHPAPGGRPG